MSCPFNNPDRVRRFKKVSGKRRPAIYRDLKAEIAASKMGNACVFYVQFNNKKMHRS